jgi:hypothetical protein
MHIVIRLCGDHVITVPGEAPMPNHDAREQRVDGAEIKNVGHVRGTRASQKILTLSRR